MRGAAPRATLYGYNLIQNENFTDATMADAMQRNKEETHVSNNSWGLDGNRIATGVGLAPAIWETAIETGLTQGAGGKGIVYVFGAGNSGPQDYANLTEVTNHHGVTTVCAVTDQGEHAPYSEQGSNLWVCAPSAAVPFGETDQHEISTTDNDDAYTDGFGGTSAATPMVSGVVALVRSANTALTWRDVKLILAASARKNDADDTGWEDGALKYGADTDRYRFNHKYGFGVVDATAAVNLAAGWTTLPPFVEQTVDSATNLNLSIDDCAVADGCPTSTPASSSLTMGAEVEFIEFVEIDVNLSHTRFRDLQLELVSPSEKVSALSVPDGGSSSFSPLMGSVRLGSAKHLGENPAGTWTLRLRDAVHQNTGTLNSWNLTVYGHQATPGAPPLDSLTPGAGSLAVGWTAPTTPGSSAITAYEVRYITTTADETDDANWTEVDTGWTAGAALAYTLSGLDTVGWDVQVRAVNRYGAGAWSSTLAGTPLSDAPSFTTASTTRSIVETATAGTPVGAPVAATDPNDTTLTYTLSGADAGAFDIASSGQLSVASGTTLDHETKPSYAVTVTATDPVTTDDPTEDAASIAVTVTVTDAPGRVTVSSTRPLVGQTLTATVTDPDAPVSIATWRWERSEEGTPWELLEEATTATYTPSADDLGHSLRVTASYTDADGTAKEVTSVQTERVGRPSIGGGGGGGGGGGSRPRDDHGNTAGRATRIEPSGRTAGRFHTIRDVDYFTLTAPHAGVVVVETTGSTDTRATVWQDGEEVASADSGGAGQNFRLSVRVGAGPVVMAVRGNGRQTGRYTLQVALMLGYLENPRPASFQSGLGVISGWVCEAEGVVIEIGKASGEVVELAAAYGTERADTAAICGDADNGFGVLFNWNLLGDGAHAVRVLVQGVPLGVRTVPEVGVVPAVVDGIELGRAPVTVTTLGAEFVEGLAGSFLVADFPRTGEQVHLVWQESQQNFVLAPAELGAALAPAPGPRAIEGVFENPRPASYQSGIGVISGWVCAAEEVVIEIDGQPIAAAAGTERADTLDVCGDVDTGFGLLVNWAEFGAGAHEVVALVDGVELSRATVTVTVVDETEPYVRGLAKRVELPGFPTPDETLTLAWQERQQNFVITGVR